jgi:transposase
MRQSDGGEPARRGKRKFTIAFKRDAVELMRRRRIEGASLAQVARELEIGPGLLWEWERKLEGPRRDAGFEGAPGETLEEENRRLRRENALLREEREFAKKALVFFARESP